MKPTNLVVAALVAVAIGLTVFASYAFVYKLGQVHGALTVSVAWKEDTRIREEATSKLRREVATKEVKHLTKQFELEKNLEKQQEQHILDLAAANAEFTERLQLSEGRAGVYRRKSEGSEAERQYLAEHATRLDRSLEEGRSLVRELRDTLKQRERVIHVLSDVILNDRTLTGEQQ